MRFSRPLVFVVFAVALAAPSAASAAVSSGIPSSSVSSALLVVCDNRQGGGAFLAGGNRYVLTSGHVVTNPDSGVTAGECYVSFPDGRFWEAREFHRAVVVFSIYDSRFDRDFAFLQVQPEPGAKVVWPSGLVASESAALGDSVSFLGYPDNTRRLSSATGHVSGFRRGTVRTDAPIAEGYSGGPVLDVYGRLIGIGARVVYRTDAETGLETVEDYEAVDILGIENWLDTEKGGHDAYLVHADPSLNDGSTPLYRDEQPPCSYLVRTRAASAVYCLIPGGERLAFPTADVYRSWYPDFSQVQYISDADLASYRLVANMTFRAGSLIKIKTDPKVYFVADNLGTLRWVSSEAAAERLFGAGWASFVHDVPDTFFLNYREGRPIS